MIGTENQLTIPQDLTRLVTLERREHGVDLNIVRESLRKDMVVLVRNLTSEQADTVIQQVAEKLGLSNELKLQAGLAGFLGHRHNIGQFFMSVNKRGDYQFITPHCEGSTFVGMQLASFYCYTNTTDGGETILLNIDDSSNAWPSMRERMMRGKVSKPLARHDIARAKALYQVNLPADLLRKDDQILEERPTEIPGLTVIEVLAKPEKTLSKILDRKLNVYWDTIELADEDSVVEFAALLREAGLLREPAGGLNLKQLDPAAHQRIWHSGVHYSDIFKCKITYKLTAGDLVLQNNMTWAHAVNNWSPGSGSRKVAAAFA